MLSRRWRWFVGSSVLLLATAVAATFTGPRMLPVLLLAALVLQFGWAARSLVAIPNRHSHLDAWDWGAWGLAAIALGWGLLDGLGRTPIDPWIGRTVLFAAGVAYGIPYALRMLRDMDRAVRELDALAAEARREAADGVP